MDLLLKHKEAFSLRDEIGTHPNIEVEIDVTDKITILHKTNIMSERKIRHL